VQPSRSLERFTAHLSAEGPSAALRYLNEGVPHRYTSVYRFDGELLRNVLLCDKRNQVRPEFLMAVPFGQSFCQFVLKDRTFSTSDSEHDPRLEGHPSRGVVVSYHSVPVLDDSAQLWGTLSHFDMQSRPLADEEFDLLERAARVLGSHVAKIVR
jgi:GAF domain-containing protein